MGRLSVHFRRDRAAADVREADSVADVARGSALLFVAQIVGNIGFFAAVLLLARGLGPADRGTIAFVIVAAFIAARITRIGVNEATIVFVAQGVDRRRGLLTNLLLWSTLGSAVSGAVVSTIFLALGGHRPAGLTATDAVMMGIGVVAVAFFEAGNGFLLGCSRYRERAVALLWGPWAYAGFLGLTQVTVGLTVPRAAACWVLGHLAWGAGVWIPSARLVGFGRPSLRLFKECVRFGARAWVGTLSDFLNFRTDQLLMGFLATESALGIYAVAVNSSEVLLYLPDAVGMALLPFVARGGVKRAGDTLRTFRQLVAVTIATLVLAAAIGPVLIPLVFGDAYHSSITPFLLLLPGAVGFAALRVFSYGMLGSDSPGRSSLAPLVSLVTGVGLDFALIPRFGANGAAAAASAAFLGGGIVAVITYRLLTGFALRELVPGPGDLAVGQLRRLAAAAGLRAYYPARSAVVRARSLRWAATHRVRARGEGIRFLFYHRVASDRDELAVRPQRFRQQMEFLAERGYRVIDVVEAADLLASGELPPRTIALSFDDGFHDVADNALPVLRELGFRATVFVSTSVADGPARFAWYRDQPPVLGWDEIVELDAQGTLRFESHTLTHPHLVRVDDERARLEIFESRRVLEERLRRTVSAFCYPAGLFGPRDRRLAIEAGYRCATSCEPGVNRVGGDLFALRRIQIDPRDRLIDFRAKALGGHDKPPIARGVYRRLRYGIQVQGLSEV